MQEESQAQQHQSNVSAHKYTKATPDSLGQHYRYLLTVIYPARTGLWDETAVVCLRLCMCLFWRGTSQIGLR